MISMQGKGEIQQPLLNISPSACNPHMVLLTVIHLHLAVVLEGMGPCVTFQVERHSIPVEEDLALAMLLKVEMAVFLARLQVLIV